MLSRISEKRYTPKEELANVWTHFIALVLSVIAAPFILFLAWDNGSFVQFIAILIYCLTMFNTYLSSSLYHWQDDPQKKQTFRIYDHISIYFLIGGTYTPFILVFYNQPEGRWFLFIHWMIILVAVIFKLFFTGRFEIISIASYLFLGWMFLFIYEPISAAMNITSFYFLIAGGLSYTIGIIFYIFKKMAFHHAIWHIFVIGGSVGHYLALWYGLNG